MQSLLRQNFPKSAFINMATLDSGKLKRVRLNQGNVNQDKLKQRKLKQGGFTLLEIMLVITLIGIAMGAIVVVVNPSDHGRDLKNEAQHFETLLKLIVDEAIFKHQEIGIKVYDDHLEFLKFDESSQTWQLFTSNDDSASKIKSKDYVDYKFPAFIEVTLEMEDAEIFLNPKIDDIETKISSIDPLSGFDELEEVEEKIEPDIYIFSSGEITAFEFEFRLRNDNEFNESSYDELVYIIAANDIGIITCKAPHLEDEKCF
jgi:general secretion pathway protein H